MEAYTKTDQQIHLLCQPFTKANRSFVAKMADDSHTNLYFDAIGNRILGRWIETPNGKLILTLNLANLKIEWLDSAYQTVKSFQTIGRKIKAIEKEIEGYLSELELNSKGFAGKLHYDIPVYDFAKEGIPQISVQDIKQWKYYRNLANQASTLLLGYLQIEGEVRIWPHHFDTGIYVVTDKGMGIGFGLAMEDSLLNDPYFYMSGYTSGSTLEFQNLPDFSNGKWIINENWKGAVLPLSELKQIPETSQVEILSQFMVKAANWFVNQQ